MIEKQMELLELLLESFSLNSKSNPFETSRFLVPSINLLFPEVM